MAVLSKSQMAEFSVDERLTLIDELWESIEGPVEDSREVPEWHAREIEERIRKADASPGAGIPLGEFKARFEKWLR